MLPAQELVIDKEIRNILEDTVGDFHLFAGSSVIRDCSESEAAGDGAVVLVDFSNLEPALPGIEPECVFAAD